jgi:hypothetical protein
MEAYTTISRVEDSVQVSSCWLKFVNDIDLSISPGGLYYKTLQTRNLRKMDRFRSKLVSFGLDKHISLSKQRH